MKEKKSVKTRKMLPYARGDKEDYARTNPNSPKGRANDIIAMHWKKNPEYAKKQFGVKEGDHTKVYKAAPKSKKHSKEDLSKAAAHMKKHGG
jgi:hypothetical protein